MCSFEVAITLIMTAKAKCRWIILRYTARLTSVACPCSTVHACLLKVCQVLTFLYRWLFGYGTLQPSACRFLSR